MMKRWLCALLCLCLFAPAALCEKKDMNAFSADCFRRRKVVGGAVIIGKDGEIVYSYAYGYKNGMRQSRVTLNTCFRIASVTKMVSAVGLMRLLEEKQLSPDTPVSDIVGFPVFNPYFPDTPITVRQVLSHTSSIKATSYYAVSWEKLKQGTPYFSKKNAPGEAFEYSNLNGGLIGAMIEALSGQSVNTYMRKNVFEPLEINAAYHPGLLRDKSDLADQLLKNGALHMRASKEIATLKKYDDTCNPRKHVGVTAGRLYISANGLFRIITMLQNGGERNGVRVLAPETVKEMTRDQTKAPGSSVTGETEYGLGLDRVYGMPGGTWYGHQGRYNGLSANAYFQPRTGLSVVVIANGHRGLTRKGVSIIAWDFMEKAQEFLKK